MFYVYVTRDISHHMMMIKIITVRFIFIVPSFGISLRYSYLVIQAERERMNVLLRSSNPSDTVSRVLVIGFQMYFFL